MMRRRQFLNLSVSTVGGVLVYSVDRKGFGILAQDKRLRIPLRFFNENEAVIVAAAAGVAAIAAVVVVATTGSSVPSIAGTWAQNGTTTFTFTSSGSNTYTVSEDYKSDPRCDAADDGTVTGSNRHYKGSIDLYSTGASAAGTCKPKVGVAQITIALAANGSSASINLVGNNCPTCKPQVWTRQS